MMIFGAFPDYRDGYGDVYVRLDLIQGFVVNASPRLLVPGVG